MKLFTLIASSTVAASYPKLKGKSLKAAKKALTVPNAGSARSKRVSGKPGIVVKQHPKPHKVLPPKAKVNVTVGS